MSTGNHIKNSVLYTSSSLKLLTLMLFGFILITQNCRSSEKEPESEGEHQRTNFAHLIEEKMPLGDLIPDEQLRYDENLLEKVKVDRPRNQMSVILDFVYLSTDQKYFKGLQKKYKTEETEEQTKTAEMLKDYLREKAFEAFSEKPTLMAYLKELREKSEGSIDLSRKLLTHRQLLLSYSQSQNETIKKLSEQITAHEKKNDELSRENRSQSETIEKFSQQLKAHEEKIDGLSRDNRSQSETIKNFSQQLKEQSEQLREQQEKIHELSEKILSQSEIIPNVSEQGRAQNEIVQALQKPDDFHKYMVPIATFTLGAGLTTIGFLWYYRLTKTI